MTSNIAAVWAFRGATLLNLILAGKAGGVISSGSRGCSNWEVVEPRLGEVWGRQAGGVHTWHWKAVIQKTTQCL